MPGKTQLDLTELIRDLADAEPAVVESAIRRLRPRLPRLQGSELRRTVEALCSLFYIDTADRPDLEPALEAATRLLARQGVKVVPILLTLMEGSDIKSHLHLARTLGRIGCDALPRLRDLLATAEDPYSRSFALYALGKMRCPEVAHAIPEVLGGMMHPDKEVRDTAARTLGQIAGAVPARRLTAQCRREMFEALIRATHDYQAPVRAKAMRSLGKMATAGLLNRQQRKTLVGIARAVLGESEEHAWDHAFIVRREARETLHHLS